MNGEVIMTRARQSLDLDRYRDLHWTGTFTEYLDLVRKTPVVTRTSFERLYDMILSYGTREYVDMKKEPIKARGRIYH